MSAVARHRIMSARSSTSGSSRKGKNLRVSWKMDVDVGSDGGAGGTPRTPTTPEIVRLKRTDLLTLTERKRVLRSERIRSPPNTSFNHFLMQEALQTVTHLFLSIDDEVNRRAQEDILRRGGHSVGPTVPITQPCFYLDILRDRACPPEMVCVEYEKRGPRINYNKLSKEQRCALDLATSRVEARTTFIEKIAQGVLDVVHVTNTLSKTAIIADLTRQEISRRLNNILDAVVDFMVMVHTTLFECYGTPKEEVGDTLKESLRTWLATSHRPFFFDSIELRSSGKFPLHVGEVAVVQNHMTLKELADEDNPSLYKTNLHSMWQVCDHMHALHALVMHLQTTRIAMEGMKYAKAIQMLNIRDAFTYSDSLGVDAAEDTMKTRKVTTPTEMGEYNYAVNGDTAQDEDVFATHSFEHKFDPNTHRRMLDAANNANTAFMIGTEPREQAAAKTLCSFVVNTLVSIVRVECDALMSRRRIVSVVPDLDADYTHALRSIRK